MTRYFSAAENCQFQFVGSSCIAKGLYQIRYSPFNIFLAEQHLSGGADVFFAGLGNVPFVKAGDAHGDALPTEDHAAFNVGFAAHVERTGLREAVQEGGNGRGLYAAADQNLRAALTVTQLKKLADGLDAQ